MLTIEHQKTMIDSVAQKSPRIPGEKNNHHKKPHLLPVQRRKQRHSGKNGACTKHRRRENSSGPAYLMTVRRVLTMWPPMDMSAVIQHEWARGTSVFDIHGCLQTMYGEEIMFRQMVGHWC
ncbi:hypothetical protein TNCV_2287551 [Trichonephila clavipes]|nr:hypothetical protein TNCV_2287551 [Trichonephila clavipes]